MRSILLRTCRRQVLAPIPYGYLSFLIYSAALVWLLTRILGPKPTLAASLQLGAAAGLLTGLITALGNYSVFDMPISAMLVWPLVTLVESAAAGVTAASVLGSERPWRRLLLVFLAALFLLVIGVVLQNLFFANGLG